MIEACRQYQMAVAEIEEQDSMKEDDCVQMEISGFNSEVYVGFEVKNLFIDSNGDLMKFNEIDVIKSLLKMKNINCEVFSKTHALVSRNVKNTWYSEHNTQAIKDEILKHAIHARETVLNFRKNPITAKNICKCRVGFIDGSKKCYDRSMPGVVN
jgi:hypothetical protein